MYFSGEGTVIAHCRVNYVNQPVFPDCACAKGRSGLVHETRLRSLELKELGFTEETQQKSDLKDETWRRGLVELV